MFENTQVDFVWYCPEYNLIDIHPKEKGFMFKDEGGEFHLMYFLDPNRPFLTVNFYLIGEL